jgi:hypothetical protein
VLSKDTKECDIYRIGKKSLNEGKIKLLTAFNKYKAYKESGSFPENIEQELENDKTVIKEL